MACFDTKEHIYSYCGLVDHENKIQNNIRILLDSLASNVVDHRGFYQTDVGDKADKLYGTILCRGGISDMLKIVLIVLLILQSCLK